MSAGQRVIRLKDLDKRPVAIVVAHIETMTDLGGVITAFYMTSGNVLHALVSFEDVGKLECWTD